MTKILETGNLTKNYGRIKAVRGLDWAVEKGAVYGLLGPNGSGKTTTLGMILGVIPPDKGYYRWFGRASSHHVRSRIGALLSEPNFYPYLTARQNLSIVCSIKGVKPNRIREYLKLVKLEKWENTPFKKYSTGMKQRLAIAATLAGDPDVLVLDEPTNGLDPQGISEVRELIRELTGNERTIVLASHLLDEVEKICSHVAVMKEGAMLASGKVDSILRPSTTIEVRSPDPEKLYKTLQDLNFIKEITRENDHFLLNADKDIRPEQVNRALYEQGVVLSYLAPRKTSLEQHFLQLTR